MDSTKKSALSEFSRRAMQRLQDKKIPKYRLLHIPSLDTDIKIRNLTFEEIKECVDIEDSDRADKYSVYLSVVDPDLRKTAIEVMEAEAELPADQRSLKEPLDIVNIFEMGELTDIAMQVMEVSGVVNTMKVTVVEQLKN
jgi:hypothetical protein